MGINWKVPCHIFDFRNNIIDDTFPYWLETLPMLQALVLQSNKFHGPLGTFKTKFPIPKLRIFDLFHNEFCGLLPTKYFDHFKAGIDLDPLKTPTPTTPSHTWRLWIG
ncbi:hypothetical protein ACSBR2_025271 [Camellia fascicularis]